MHEIEASNQENTKPPLQAGRTVKVFLVKIQSKEKYLLFG